MDVYMDGPLPVVCCGRPPNRDPDVAGAEVVEPPNREPALCVGLLCCWPPKMEDEVCWPPKAEDVLDVPLAGFPKSEFEDCPL